MKTIYLLDWLISKHVAVHEVPDHVHFEVGEKVIYVNKEDNKKYIGMNVGYALDCEKQGVYSAALSGKSEEQFQSNQQRALEFYKLFKAQFGKQFAGAVPITARSDLFGSIMYFYFYSEERYNFAEFVKSFRQQLPCQFFIYQVGARDMIRLSSHGKDHMIACGCGPMGCCSLGKLPSVEMDNIALQSLEWRDVEKLKWRCWKLKCSMVYERVVTAAGAQSGVLYRMAPATVRESFSIERCACTYQGELPAQAVALVSSVLTTQLDDSATASLDTGAGDSGSTPMGHWFPVALGHAKAGHFERTGAALLWFERGTELKGIGADLIEVVGRLLVA